MTAPAALKHGCFIAATLTPLVGDVNEVED